MQGMMTREAAERRLAELRDEERQLREAEAAAQEADENERRALLTALERGKEAERAARLATARDAFIAAHKTLVSKLLELVPELAAWEQTRRSSMGSAGITGQEVRSVREVAASVGVLARARQAAEKSQRRQRWSNTLLCSGASSRTRRTRKNGARQPKVSGRGGRKVYVVGS